MFSHFVFLSFLTPLTLTHSFTLPFNGYPLPTTTHHLWDIVAPGKEEDSSQVLLPMWGVEASNNIPQYKVESQRGDAVVHPTKYGPDAGRNEEGGPGVQTMIKQFP